MLVKTVLIMALFRFLSGSIEIFVAYLMLKWNDVEKALILNSTLAFIGPLILIITTTIGVMGISDKISFSKFFWIFLGVFCIIHGIKE